jgi:hypothetical protein
MFKLRPIEELVKYERNPRKITDVDLAKLIQSIRDNGEYFNARPIILSDRTGELVIIAGNQRYEAAKFLELDLVPTYLISGLTEEKEKEILVRDNVSSGSFDWDMLYNEWNEAQLNDWGLDISFPDQMVEEAGENEPVGSKGLSDTTIRLEYTYDDYLIVKEQLAKIDASPEQAVWKLLGNK